MVSAKDFDDAFLQKTDSVSLFVSIADVAEYVEFESALDLEALHREHQFILKERLSQCCLKKFLTTLFFKAGKIN